jgi:hypothetical protein
VSRTFTIIGASDFTPDLGSSGHFYLAVTAGCGQAWYPIPRASCGPLIDNLAFSPAAHTGEPFCPYTHHHAGLATQAFPPEWDWYGLELGYDLHAGLDTVFGGPPGLEIKISGYGMSGLGQSGEKSIQFTGPWGSLPGRNRVKWEGYDNKVYEVNDHPVNLICPVSLERAEYPLDVVQRVVSEGTYYYSIDARSRDDANPDLWVRHRIWNLAVEVRYNLTDVSIECPHP